MEHGIKGPAYLFFAFTLAGTSVVAARYVTGKLGIFTITSISLVFTLLFLVLRYRRRIFPIVFRLSVREYMYLALQAICGIFLFRMFLLAGLRGTSSGEAGILTSVTPSITAVLAILFLKERAGAGKLAGIALTIAGVLLIQGILLPGGAFSAGHIGGNMLVICAASSEALFNILSRSFAVKGRESPRPVLEPPVQTAIVSFMAFMLCLVPALWENPLARLCAVGPAGWLALAWYGVFVTALAFICWYEGILRCGALTAAAFSGMMPFTSALLSYLILGEGLGIVQLSGGILIAGGMVLLGVSAARENAVRRDA